MPWLVYREGNDSPAMIIWAKSLVAAWKMFVQDFNPKNPNNYRIVKGA